MSFDSFNKAFAPTRTPFDWLSRDRAEVDRYIADPLCGFPATTSLWVDLLDAMVRETETRYLIVTHNAVTMSRMHRLFGVTMVEKGVSRLVSVDLGGAEELLAAE